MKPRATTRGAARAWLRQGTHTPPRLLASILIALALLLCSAAAHRRFWGPNAQHPFTANLGLSIPQILGFASPANAPLTAHEWGTFTSIAGIDGVALEWQPLTGSTDLPSFVEHLHNAQFKGGLRGTIRMETPVLYFYSPRETTLSVHASFAKGLITEWYPRASVPPIDPRRDLGLAQKHTEGTITWRAVRVQPGAPGDFPRDDSRNHYYAARQTSSAPLSIDTSAGPQCERFLFYRGVSDVLPPLTATLSPDEATILLQNHFPTPIANVILFERRDAHVGYRILGPLQDQASFAPPALDGSLESLFSNLEGLLISEGLFPDEAHAMLETWKNSWFEEGSRVLYILPRAFVESVLPLTITPAPTQLTRVFLGRLELITPATRHAIESAFATGDHATVAKYGRFLEPILSTMIEQSADKARKRRYSSYLNSVLNMPAEQLAVQAQN